MSRDKMIAGVVAVDKDKNPVVLVEVKAKVASREDFLQFVGRLQERFDLFPFGMFVDLEEIVVLRNDVDNPESLRRLSAVEIFRHYDPDFAGKDTPYGSNRIFREYLEGLAEGWLRDLAYRWKSANPPGAKELAGLGLVERLEEGTTYGEVQIGGLALR